jgi:hypothetical protein
MSANWFSEFTRRAVEARDMPRIRLVLLAEQGFELRETDPDRTLALFDEGRRLAEALREPWMVLRYKQKYVHALLHFKRDFRRVLEPAVANALEVRKPPYQGYPERFSVFCDLVDAYARTDPAGHADAIRDTLAGLEADGPLPLGQQLFLLSLRRDAAILRDDLDEAAATARQAQAVAEENPGATADHYSVFNWSGWCQVHFRRGEWEALAEAADQGEEVGTRVGHKMELSEFILWQALLARRAGEREKASRLRLRAVGTLSQLQMPPTDPIYEALAAYHEQGGEPDQALAVRDRELAAASEQGRTISEVNCQRERVRLLHALGRLTAQDLETARASAARLRDPGPHLAELDRYSPTRA